MPMIMNVDGVDIEMTPEEEADFLASLPPVPPRYLDRYAFYRELAAQSLYGSFNTWLASQADAVKVYFTQAPGFYEDDTKIADAMTALSTTPEDFYTASLG